MPLERELKFSLLDESFPEEEALLNLFKTAGLALKPQKNIENRDRYYDDATGSLEKAGFALRRRKGSNQNLATLKTKGRIAGALHEREEIEVPLMGYHWPSDIVERVAPITDPHLLREQLELKTSRRRYQVSRELRPVALISFDEVSARYPDANHSVHFNEAEIEAIGNVGERDLQTIADLIGQLSKLTPNTYTKLERAKALLSLGASFQNED